MWTIPLLTLFACFWKDFDSAVSKPFKNLTIVDMRKINKYQIYINAKTLSFNSRLTGKHYNLKNFLLNFNRIKFNLSAIYSREGFWRFYQYQAAWQLPRHWNASSRGAGKARASRIRQLRFNCPTRPSALCNCKKDERLGTRLWSFCIRAKSQIYRGCSSPLSKYLGWVNSPRRVAVFYPGQIENTINLSRMKRLSPFPQIKTKDCDLQGFTISKLEKTLSVETLSLSGLPLKHNNFKVPQNTEGL